ncbi:hypothetical protein ACIGHF_07375 [Stenotrophomonas sp. NPDC077464]|uniref:hypothetical protein n=1 Tax=unclassified Stenotrophomonas TaxID=196198 RepID=UPI0037CF868E
MAVRVQCLHCRRFFDVSYLEMCSTFSRHNPTTPWEGQCPFCSAVLRLPFWVEAVAFLIAVATFFAGVLMAGIFTMWVAVVLIVAGMYLLPGVWRYYAADLWKVR